MVPKQCLPQEVCGREVTGSHLQSSERSCCTCSNSTATGNGISEGSFAFGHLFLYSLKWWPSSWVKMEQIDFFLFFLLSYRVWLYCFEDWVRLWVRLWPLHVTVRVWHYMCVLGYFCVFSNPPNSDIDCNPHNLDIDYTVSRIFNMNIRSFCMYMHTGDFMIDSLIWRIFCRACTEFDSGKIMVWMCILSDVNADFFLVIQKNPWWKSTSSERSSLSSSLETVKHFPSYFTVYELLNCSEV